MGIHINGGTVIATGNMLDHIADGGQNYAVFSFRQRQSGDNIITLQNSDGGELMALWPVNDYSVLVYSSPDLAAGDYTLYSNNALLAHSTAGGGFGGGFGGMMPPGQEGGDGTPPADFDPQQGQPPELPEGMEFPAEGSLPERPAHMDQSEAGTPPELPPQDGHGRHDDGTETEAGALNSVFTIADGANQFGGVTAAE